MTSDGNRGAVLTYNYLNLPKTVTLGGKTLTYDYHAAGTKHKYVADTLTAKYAGGFEYNQLNVFKRLSISEGQAVYRKDTIRFDYFLKDHLGNVRVVFDERGRILQRTDYYPFGLEIDRNAPVQTPSARNNVNQYRYNGKELQVGTGFVDYGARMDPPYSCSEEISTILKKWGLYVNFLLVSILSTSLKMVCLSSSSSSWISFNCWLQPAIGCHGWLREHYRHEKPG
jgi:hypothetical protein